MSIIDILLPIFFVEHVCVFYKSRTIVYVVKYLFFYTEHFYNHFPLHKIPLHTYQNSFSIVGSFRFVFSLL